MQPPIMQLMPVSLHQMKLAEQSHRKLMSLLKVVSHRSVERALAVLHPSMPRVTNRQLMLMLSPARVCMT